MSCSVRAVPGGSEVVTIEVSLFGGAFRGVDVAVEHRRSAIERWAAPTGMSSPSVRVSDGVARFAPCSPSGALTLFSWDSSLDGYSHGDRCLLRVSVAPSSCEVVGQGLVRASSAGLSTGSSLCRMNGFSDGVLCGRDWGGNSMVLGDHEFSVVAPSGETVARVDGLHYPKAAVETNWGYAVLDSWNSRVLALDRNGSLTNQVDLSGIADKPEGMGYGRSSETLLVSGGEVHRVYELSWLRRGVGRLLWQHGDASPGNGPSQLNHPAGVCYGGSSSVVLIADEGNDRVVAVDRSPSGSVSTIGEAEVGGAWLGLRRPRCVASCGGAVVIGEGEGEGEGFSESRFLHPSMRRWAARGRDGDADADVKDDLPQYGGMLFVPILGGDSHGRG